MTDFSAKEPSLGYYYQIRLSLYLLLKSNIREAVVYIETLDDIVVADLNTNLYQTKLHINSIANLTDSSPDFWKTIRVWSENIVKNQIDLDNTFFCLMTTAKIGETSFLVNFKKNAMKTSKEILKKMYEIINSSGNKSIDESFKAFKKLNHTQQLKLIENITIVDSSLSIDGTLNEIKKELRLSCTPNKIEILLERIEGWWFQESIKCLQKTEASISFKSLSAKINEIQDSFQSDNLPDDFADPLVIDENDLNNFEDKIFIKQLKLISAKSHVLRNAISDFRRAFEQRSKWLREDLASIEEVTLFEKRLHDHWNNIFSALKDSVEGLSLEELEKIGYNFYKTYYIDTIPQIKIRTRFQSEYLTRGSCHLLADNKKIGWHPNYLNLLN